MMSSTLAWGFAERIAANAPATCGAAIEVPLKKSKPPPGTDDLIWLPGASRVRKVALLLNPETVSLFVVDPTLTELEMQAGKLRALVSPSLPDEMMDAIPAARKASMATFTGSSSQNVVNEPPPKLIFTAAML